MHLLSLRAQLQHGGGSKPVIAVTLNENNAHDASRCCAVAWVPRSGGAQFLVAHASGNILVYKKVCVCVCVGGWVGGGVSGAGRVAQGAPRRLPEVVRSRQRLGRRAFPATPWLAPPIAPLLGTAPL